MGCTLSCLVVAMLAGAGCDYVFRLDHVETVQPPASLARWELDEAAGLLLEDAVEPRLDLAIEASSSYTWQPGLLRITGPARIRSQSAAGKLIEAWRASATLTVEVWVTPLDASIIGTGPARIFTISAGPSASNLMIGQSNLGEWVVRLRTSLTDDNGGPDLKTMPLVVPPTEPTHLVLVHDGLYRTLYVDGVEQARDSYGGDLAGWNDGFLLGVANEIATGADERPWVGDIHRIEVFAHALDHTAIETRFAIGPS